MQYREDARLYNGKNRHRFSRAIDSYAPLLTKEQQYSRDECTRVPDAYPPHKVSDVPRPAYRLVEPPYAYTISYG